MARRIKNSKIDSRLARGNLAIRREPYWCSLSGGLALGYRKGKKGGHWIAKHYSAEHGRHYLALGHADDAIDVAEADAGISTFDQAQEAARAWLTKAEKNGGAPRGPYKVNQACDDYLEFLRSDGRSDSAIAGASYTIKSFIRPKLGEFDVADLTAKQLRRWHADLARIAPRMRTKAKEKQRHRKTADERARKATANRILTTLKAALNHAFDDELVASNKAWGRKVKPFKGVDRARLRYLQIVEAKRLINACDPDFRRLVQAALQSGARYGQLNQLVASDFNPDVGALRLRSSKGDGTEKVFHATLADEAVEFFKQACAGRAGTELVFRKDDGTPWIKSHQARPMIDACKIAKISPTIGFHGLRHTWASHAVMNGVPLLVVAKNLGHSDTRMVEKHYGHLAPSYVTDAIRAGAPKFDFKRETKVVALAR